MVIYSIKYKKMQYHKIIEQSEYDNDGNYSVKTKYKIFDPKMYIYGFDCITKTNERKLEIFISHNINNSKTIFTYIESKNNTEYNYHGNNNSDKIYKIICEIFGIKQDNNVVVIIPDIDNTCANPNENYCVIA
jgi:hypothetical protein